MQGAISRPLQSRGGNRDETRRLSERLGALCQDVDRATTPELAIGIGASQPFLLAYQGQNNRDPQAFYGFLVCRVMAERSPSAALPEPPVEGEPVRVGIVSGFF